MNLSVGESVRVLEIQVEYKLVNTVKRLREEIASDIADNEKTRSFQKLNEQKNWLREWVN